MLLFADFHARRRIPELDGFRALAVLLVMSAHPVYPHVWPALHGATGVTLFFVLSGFLITTLLLREEEGRGGIDLGGFFLRRLFRIYPLYFLILALYCGLILGAGLQPERRPAFTQNLPWFVLFFPEHAMFFNTSGVEVPFNMSWSVGIEEKFYLVWPVVGFVLLAGLRRLRPAFLVMVVAVATVVGQSAVHGPAVAPYACIALGCLVAVVLDRPRGYAVLARAGRPWALAPLTALVLALQFGTDEILLGGRLYEAYAFVIALLLAGVVTTTSRGVGWLASRPLGYVAGISYALYLVHNFGLNAAEGLLPGDSFAWSLLSTVVGVGAAVAVCHVLHAGFEEPMRKYGVRLAASRRERREGRGGTGTGVTSSPVVLPQEPRTTQRTP